MERLHMSLHGMSVQSFDMLTYDKMRADTINNTPGNETGYDCPECMNRGMMAYPREDGSIFTRACKCMTIRRCVREMERSGLKNCIRELTFEAYKATEPWQKALKTGIMEYAREGSGWLLVGGQSGSGKTHLCTAVSRKLLWEGKELLYMPWREKIAQLKAMSLDSEKRTKMMEAWKTAQVLYIDDLFKTGKGADGSETPSQADIGLAFEILNHRYINHLPTILSTERTPQELVAIDEATGSRIIEAAGKHVYSIGRDQKRNYRLRHVTEL